MTNARILELLKIERECVSRNGQCDRDCAKCDLVQIDSDLIEMYGNAIELYQEIVEGKAVVWKGWNAAMEPDNRTPIAVVDRHRKLGFAPPLDI